MASQEKLLKLQMGVRENAEELKDYLKDLDAWEEDIKKQDKTFNSMKPKHDEKLVVPIRSKKKAKPKPKDTPAEEKPKRIRSYDFKAWDKLNVDKMLEQMDTDDEENFQESKIDGEKLDHERRDIGIKEKEKGNDHFKKGNYNKSVEHYTRGMQYDPDNPLLPANRAMAYLKLQKYVESEADCTLSLSLDPAYVKAYLRRGAARHALGKVQSAIKDFNDVLKLEPENKQAKMELENIKKQKQKTKIKQTEESSQAKKEAKSDLCLVRPLNKPLHLQSKKPLRRIPVEEVGHELDVVVNGEKDTTQKTAQPPQTNPSILVLDENDKSDDLHKSLADTNNNTDDKKDSSVIMTNGHEEKSSKTVSTTPTFPGQKAKPTIPALPTTCFQFQADVKKLHFYPLLLCEYLKQLDPKNIRNLLKDQLETEILVDIVKSFNEDVIGNEEFILDFLFYLTSVKRFDMAIMFLSPSNRKEIKELFDKIHPLHSERCLQMEKLYGL
ncbi:unnamed protein product [Clavelina lepadiformis]|uniref:RNA polymerase II-associated protein 3 n=2 Tax=Clavelina lepadiformis TaxID=159417 RepID=A0ABP0GFL2_CLALP